MPRRSDAGAAPLRRARRAERRGHDGGARADRRGAAADPRPAGGDPAAALLRRHDRGAGAAADRRRLLLRRRFRRRRRRCACLEPLVAPKAVGRNARLSRDHRGARRVRHRLARGSGRQDGRGRRRRFARRAAACSSPACLSEGIDPATTFGAVLEVEFAGGGGQLVAAGAADAAFAWSSLAGDVASGYSRGTLADLVARGEIAMDRLAVVWRSPPIGHGPFAVCERCRKTTRRGSRATCWRSRPRNPDAYDMLDPFYGGGYAPSIPRTIAGSRRCSRRTSMRCACPAVR